jgi:hypothetical protein
LHVIDGDEHRRVLRQTSYDGTNTGCDRSLLDLAFARIDDEQRHIERCPLWRRKLIPNAFRDPREKIAHGRERKGRLRRAWSAGHDREPLPCRKLQRFGEERRFADTSLPLDEQRRKAFPRTSQDTLDGRDLLVPADELQLCRSSVLHPSVLRLRLRRVEPYGLRRSEVVAVPDLRPLDEVARLNVDESELGARIHLRDVETIDDVGNATAPLPVEPGDVVATVDELFRIEVTLDPPPGVRVVAVLARRVGIAEITPRRRAGDRV